MEENIIEVKNNEIGNVMTGQVREDTFNPSDKFQDAVIEKKEMLYLYNDGQLYYFMDNETYEQMPLNKESVEDGLNVSSLTCPVITFLIFALTNGEPLPGLTCKNSITL